MRKNQGFTLIEMIMVIVIIGILAIVAVPQFFDISGDADQAAEDGIVGAVRAGILTSQANTLAGGGAAPGYPETLDANADGACATCFSTVLGVAVSDANWSKAGLVYTAPDTSTYTYVPATGAFQ